MTELLSFGETVDLNEMAQVAVDAGLGLIELDPPDGRLGEIVVIEPPEPPPLVYVDGTGEYHIPHAELQRYLRFTAEQLEAVNVMRNAGIAESVIDQAFPRIAAGPEPIPTPPAATAPAPESQPPSESPPPAPGPPRIPRPGPCAARNGLPHLPSKYMLTTDRQVLGICQCGTKFPSPCPHRQTRGPGLGQTGDIVCTWCDEVIIRRSGFIDNRNPAWSGRSPAGAADPKAGVQVLGQGDQPAPTIYRGTAV